MRTSGVEEPTIISGTITDQELLCKLAVYRLAVATAGEVAAGAATQIPASSFSEGQPGQGTRNALVTIWADAYGTALTKARELGLIRI